MTITPEGASIEIETPYGTIRFNAKIWLKTEFRDGKLVVCDSSIRSSEAIPVGVQVTSP